MLRGETGIVGKYMHTIGVKGVGLAKAQVGVDTGKLKSSISYKVIHVYGQLATRITASDKKAIMHHNGTKPHIITPRKKQTLRFQKGGKIVYAKVVFHPGTKPNRFLTDQLPKLV